MGNRLKWDRAKPARPAELKYDEGTILPNGTVVAKPLDSLAKRAKAAEDRWLQQNRMKSLNDKPKAKRRKKQRHKGPIIPPEPPPFDDIALTALDQMEAASHG